MRAGRAGVLALLFVAACAHAAASGQHGGDFTLTDLAGREVRLSSFQGKVVVLDFWATWCGPCRQELPALEALAKSYQAAGKPVVVVAVSIDKDKARAEGLVRELRLNTITVLHDPDGAVAARFDLPTMPTSYVLDRQGGVRQVHAGFEPGDEDKIAGEIDGLLK